MTGSGDPIIWFRKSTGKTASVTEPVAEAVTEKVVLETLREVGLLAVAVTELLAAVLKTMC